MNTMQTKVPTWISAVGTASRPWSAGGLAPRSEASAYAAALSPEDTACFMRVVAEAGRIRRHVDLYRWLSGDLQQLLPHEILLCAWGDFAGWSLKFDLVSGVPGVRTAALAHCPVDGLVREAYGRWSQGGRNPIVLRTAEMDAARNPCHCVVHAALRGMRSLLVHGVHDKRSDQESIFLTLTSRGYGSGRSLDRLLGSLDALFPQIDHAFRRVPAFPLREPRIGAGHAAVLDLSTREIEVLEALCRGRTNFEIAAALSISPFTVKNHVQRIFRKIGVTNRTQAAARYAEAMLHAAVSNVAHAQEVLKEAG